MTTYSRMLALFAIIVLALAFVMISGAGLPSIVASHFAAGGVANGFAPREGYLTLLAILVIGVPSLFLLASSLVRVVPMRYVNLPHREYWLAPERSSETLAFIQDQGLYFAMLICGFLCFVHWLVVLANQRVPPLFPERLFVAGAATFLVLFMGCIVVFIFHFRRPP